MTFGAAAHLMTLCLYAGLLLAAAAGDVRHYRIPNGYSLAIVALFPVFALTASHSVAPLASVGVMLGVLAVGFAAFALGWFGGGDAKLLSAASLFAGPTLIGEFFVVMALTGGVVALVMLCRHFRFRFATAPDGASSPVLRHALTAEKLPYGVAIAVGGIFVALRLAGMAGGSP